MKAGERVGEEVNAFQTVDSRESCRKGRQAAGGTLGWRRKSEWSKASKALGGCSRAVTHWREVPSGNRGQLPSLRRLETGRETIGFQKASGQLARGPITGQGQDGMTSQPSAVECRGHY